MCNHQGDPYKISSSGQKVSKRGHQKCSKSDQKWPFFDHFLDPFWSTTGWYICVIIKETRLTCPVVARGCQKGVTKSAQKVPKMSLFWVIFDDPFLLKKCQNICRQSCWFCRATLSMDFDHFLDHFWVTFWPQKVPKMGHFWTISGALPASTDLYICIIRPNGALIFAHLARTIKKGVKKGSPKKCQKPCFYVSRDMSRRSNHVKSRWFNVI